MIRFARLRPFLRRQYHSPTHSGSNSIVEPKLAESKILSKSLEYIPKYGFNELCITQAIRDLDYSDSILSLFTSNSNGLSLEYLIVLHWLKTQRQALQSVTEDPKSEIHSISNEYERIAYLINKRLEYNIPIVNRLVDGLSHMVSPLNVTKSLDELHNLSDDIAFYAGDKSNDFAWYSKRLGISTIYVSSEMFMLQDTSKDFVHTRSFVNDKVSNLHSLGSSYNNVEQWGVFNAFSLINLIKSQLSRG